MRVKINWQQLNVLLNYIIKKKNNIFNIFLNIRNYYIEISNQRKKEEYENYLIAKRNYIYNCICNAKICWIRTATFYPLIKNNIYILYVTLFDYYYKPINKPETTFIYVYNKDSKRIIQKMSYNPKFSSEESYLNYFRKFGDIHKIYFENNHNYFNFNSAEFQLYWKPDFEEYSLCLAIDEDDLKFFNINSLYENHSQYLKKLIKFKDLLFENNYEYAEYYMDPSKYTSLEF